MKYILHGPPIPLQRPRLATRPTPHAYDPQKHQKENSQLDLRMQKVPIVIKGPIHLKATFFMPIPKSLSKKKQEALLGQPHIKRPDLSNLIKYLEDVAQGILFHDDSIISTITATKIYDTKAYTEFALEEVIG